PKISGTAREGNTLSASIGAWGGTKPITFTGVWKRCDGSGNNCSAVTGTENQLQYKLTSSDVGHTMRVTVTATNSDGHTSATSNATAVVKPAPASAPRNTSAPTISGTAEEGQVLSGDR